MEHHEAQKRNNYNPEMREVEDLPSDSGHMSTSVCFSLGEITRLKRHMLPPGFSPP